jgi:hypothetical protein
MSVSDDDVSFLTGETGELGYTPALPSTSTMHGQIRWSYAVAVGDLTLYSWCGQGHILEVMCWRHAVPVPSNVARRLTLRL